MPNGASHAVKWAPDGTITDLGVLPGQGSSAAEDINAAGVIVGSSGDDAAVWPVSGQPYALPDNGFNGAAAKITDDGWVLGTAEVAPDDDRAVVWDAAHRMWDMTDLVDRTTFIPSYAAGINDNHQVAIYGEGGAPGQASSSVLVQLPSLP